MNNKLKESNKISNLHNWFTYENMLQIIEIDPFNIINISKIEFYTLQELLSFDNTNHLNEILKENSKLKRPFSTNRNNNSKKEKTK